MIHFPKIALTAAAFPFAAFLAAALPLGAGVTVVAGVVLAFFVGDLTGLEGFAGVLLGALGLAVGNTTLPPFFLTRSSGWILGITPPDAMVTCFNS